ncbi:MAG: response regulator transcription factor [Chitinophagaceae bacterium]|nr:response regulator transcription factor [Chitinophagaceae bacterium]
MIKAFILDDQDTNIILLKSCLARFFPDIQVCGSGIDPLEAIQQISSTKPDLLFLDISMPELNGFEFLQKIGGHLAPEVIFVTAYGEYALQAFEFQASGYLTKPVDTTKLVLTVNKILDHIRQRKVLTLIEEGKQDHADREGKKLTLPTQNGLLFVAADTVCYCSSSGNYTVFHMIEEPRQLLVSRQIGQFEPVLSPQGFIRIHDRYIVNLKYIKAYLRGNGGMLVLENGTELPVSARRKKLLMQYLV